MSMYRNVVWYFKGLNEYTKKGYSAAAKGFNPADLQVNVTGRSFMITGANSGIGKSVATEIAKKGGTVHMVCRSKERGEQAKNEIIEASRNSDVHLHQLDMSNPRDVWKFVKEFEASGKALNVLVNNAGCMINDRQVDADGLEKNFATNTLATHILTTGLMSLLKKSEKPRVVIVTSGGMLVQQLNVDDLQFERMKPFDGTMAYAQNKRQQVVMTEEYSKMEPAIHFSTMHPGWADTPAVQNSMPDFYERMKNKLRTAEEGADTLTWLCVSNEAVSYPSGLFFQDRKPAPRHLPLAWTKPKSGDQEKFMKILQELSKRFEC